MTGCHLTAFSPSQGQVSFSENKDNAKDMKHRKRRYTAPATCAITVEMGTFIMASLPYGGGATEAGKPTPRAKENTIWDDQWLETWGSCEQ